MTLLVLLTRCTRTYRNGETFVRSSSTLPGPSPRCSYSKHVACTCRSHQLVASSPVPGYCHDGRFGIFLHPSHEPVELIPAIRSLPPSSNFDQMLLTIDQLLLNSRITCSLESLLMGPQYYYYYYYYRQLSVYDLIENDAAV